MIDATGLAVCPGLNVMGSAGDMLMMRKLVPYPRATSFEDTGEGFVAYGPVSGFESQ